jgi:translocator protein
MKNITKLLATIVGCELVGVLGTPFTIAAIPTWYAGLYKPIFAPPNWLFGPIWTLLYCLMGISIYLIWQLGLKRKVVNIAVRWFFIQLGLNFIWTPIFFGLRAPLGGLVIIIAMWGAIALTIQKFYALSRTAGYLLVPYLLWVSLATLLNLAIVILN